MPLSLGQMGAFLLALVETVKDALARRLFKRKEEPWHPLPPEEKEPRD